MADRAITEISLKDVRRLIEDKDIGEDVADTVGTILGVVLALAGAGPAALPLWALIEPNNELIEAVKSTARKISRSKPSDYLDRAERMAAANCLLVYEALFDAVRQRWPSIIRELGLTQEEAKTTLAQASARSRPISDESVADLAVRIPHPADPSLSSERVRRAIYTGLATRFLSDALPETGDQRDREAMGARDGWTLDIMDRAEALYQAEYLGMAVEFQQFFIWSVLQDQVAGREQIRDLAGDQRTWFELISRATYSLDLGMQGLAEAIARLPRPVFGDTAPTGTGQANVQAVAEGLHRTYAYILQQQVINDQFAVKDTGARLGFPRKIDGFIPQAYRIALYDDKDMHLEDEDGWSAREVYEDIGALILRYLESPYSVQTPLLLLGHPGSGKSLLTEMLAGHLGYPAYTTVCVKLRGVDPDVGLLTQLETQILEDTGLLIEWADFAEGLSMCPPVVILDGYDELLQATGKVFAGYLEDVRLFQHQQAVEDRPVRVIVTSRLTLIDKAAVPLGTTVVKLEEFDRPRRDAWCEVWNKENKAYFNQNGIRAFAVPDHGKLLELARQPLLLLMLAIYDSNGNELSAQPSVDQTLLYDRLLHRFIERELSKRQASRDWQALAEADQRDAVDRQMVRLGVAAIGMFNRQSVTISREELNEDLRYFGTEQAELTGLRPLQHADLLFGSFFFIHESRSRLQQGPAEPAGRSVAFEFLNNTFGEFLTADYILRCAIAEAQTLHALSESPRMGDTRRRRLAMLSEAWFGCLVHTPLHTRPRVLNTLNEWGRHQLSVGQDLPDLLKELDAAVSTQLRTVLNDVTIPDPDPQARALSPYRPLPRRGQVAVYSLNLVLLCAYLAPDAYVLEESDLGDDGGLNPWDSLTSLWRAWFTPESLEALAAVMAITRQNQQILLSPGTSEMSEFGGFARQGGFPGSAGGDFAGAVVVDSPKDIGDAEFKDLSGNDPGLIFRAYVPSDRLYAAELDKFMSLFRRWLGEVRGIGIRQSGYETSNGRMYEFYLGEHSADIDLGQARAEFSDFLMLAMTDAPAAADKLIREGISRTDALNFASRYGRDIRRLNVDLKQERERRILAIMHGIESDMVESGAYSKVIARQIKDALEAVVPDLSADTYLGILEARQLPAGAEIEININQQVISAVEGPVIQNVGGTINLGPRARELLALIDEYGGVTADSLRTAVYEVEDKDAPSARRREAKKRLKEFLFETGKITGFTEDHQYAESVLYDVPVTGSGASSDLTPHARSTPGTGRPSGLTGTQPGQVRLASAPDPLPRPR